MRLGKIMPVCLCVFIIKLWTSISNTLIGFRSRFHRNKSTLYYFSEVIPSHAEVSILLISRKAHKLPHQIFTCLFCFVFYIFCSHFIPPQSTPKTNAVKYWNRNFIAREQRLTIFICGQSAVSLLFAVKAQ